ncbi:uncharacterized protein LOC135960786 [Calliphora vicina]|uniref:uncharacterized protein LOC135960786 n=1 Tax=Calliphora vicina TaxID=7373 RepID=UPI00325B5C1A
MLEDSITSSPSKSNKSIHEARLKRKNKRKKADEILQINSDQEQIVGLHRIIDYFYKDSDGEHSENEATNSTFLVTKPPAIIRNYKPFEMEKSLAIADHISSNQVKQNKPNLWPETQGFFTCKTLTELELAREQQTKDLNENYKQNSSFTITESEMISCCHNAENLLQHTTSKEIDKANSIAEELSPKKNDDMSLVNSILEDFSQSPLSKEQIIINTSYQYTPEFRLRRRPEKTYSRKFLNTTKTNLNTRFEDLPSAVSYDDDHSNCSSLSVQEDLTFDELSNNNDTTPTSANNTQRLCENLLNLSVYFTQNNQSFSDDQQDTNLFSDKMSDLVKDILTLRSICPNNIRYDSYDSIEDFHGFPSHSNANERDVIDIENAELDSRHTTLNITHDLNIPLNEEENASFEDWNEDDCHGVFANINTENILQEENIQNQNKKLENFVELAEDKLPKNPDLTSNNLVGLKTASSKPIKVSREAHIMAAKILSKLPDIPAFEKNTDVNDCDTGNIIRDVNIFENVEDYEWEDDCDLFLNFQTPITSKGKHATEEHEQQHKTNELQIPQQVLVVPSTSKMAAQGFKTAGGKNVHISKKALDSVEKLLKEFTSDDKDYSKCEEDLKEIKCKVYAKTHKFEAKQQSCQSDIKEIINRENGEPIIVSNIGFQTAKGRNITISEKAQQSVKSILKEFSVEQGQSFENSLEIMKQNINKKNNECKHSIPAANVSKAGKNVEFSKEQQVETPHSSTNLPQINSSKLLENNMGFQTANGKKLKVSTKAQQNVDKMLKEFFDDSKKDFLSDLKSIKNDVNKKNDKYKMAVKNTNIVDSSHYIEKDESLTDIMLSEWPLATQHETAAKEGTKNNEEIREKPIENKVVNMGFKTANGRNVSISAKAQQTVAKLLQEFNTDLDINKKYENDLIEMKTKIEIKNKELKHNDSSSINTKSSQVNNDKADTTLSEWPINPANVMQQNITPKPMMGKRKQSTNNNDIATPEASTSPPAKVLKRSLYNSKSLFAEQSLQSPVTSSAISRKNLLSLTKRRNSKRSSTVAVLNEEIPKINKEKYDLSAAVETPIKSSVSLRANVQTPVTPNLRDFISNAPLTSTPRINALSNSPETIKDTDFTPITWQHNNNSITNKSTNNSNHTTKLSDTSSLNITVNSSNPTAKERIGRLKMYGKAPAVSPILIETHHNCRPSGLRRTRSMLKKTEK